MVVSRILKSSIQRRLLGQLKPAAGENAFAFFLSWRKIRNLSVRANAEYHLFSACQQFFANILIFFKHFFENIRRMACAKVLAVRNQPQQRWMSFDLRRVEA
jgi:hypothetical protein